MAVRERSGNLARVSHGADVSVIEDRSVGIGVDRDHGATCVHAEEMRQRAGHIQGQD